MVRFRCIQICLVFGLFGCQSRSWILRGHSEHVVFDLAFSECGQWLASAGHDGRVLLYDVRDRSLKRELAPTSCDAPDYIEFMDRGRHLLVVSDEIAVYDVHTGALTKKVALGHSPHINLATPALGKEANLLVVPMPQDGVFGRWMVETWDLGRMRRIAGRPIDRGPVRDLALKESANRCAVAVGRDALLLTAEDLTTVRCCSHSAAVTDVDIATDGRFFASADLDWNLCIWDLDSGELVHSASLSDTKNYDRAGRLFFPSIAFSSDGTLLAVGLGWSVVIVDPGTGERVSAFEVTADGNNGSGDPVKLIGFTANGRYVVTKAGGALQIWAVPGGQFAGRLGPVPEGMGPVAFGPNGRLVATGGTSVKHPARVRLWELVTP